MSIAASTSALPNRPRGEALQADRTEAHLVRLPGTNWNLWRSFVVRGAGFPAVIIDELAAPETVVAADRYLACQTLASRHRDAALRRLRGELDTSSNVRRELHALKAAIMTGNMEGLKNDPQIQVAAEAHRTAQQSHKIFVAAYQTEAKTIDSRLVSFACEPRFREAMLWQGLDPTHHIWHNLQPESPAHARRKAMRQIAMRVQRYAVKNDSIGFFGPVVWGTIEEDALPIEVRPGPGLLADRKVFFEGWAIDAFAAALDTDELKPWVAPRIKSGIWIHEGYAYRPQRKGVRLSEEERVVLSYCDGNRTAQEVAKAVLKERLLSANAQEKDIFAVLEQLVAAGLIMWRLEVASQLHPDLELANRLARIEDPALREHRTSALEELLQARDRVALAAGDATELDKAFQELHSCFTRLTSQSSSRRGGKTYGGRTLVYEDCRRDCEVQIGTKLLEELAQPLGVLLDSARWVMAEVGCVLKKQLRQFFTELLELHKESGQEIDSHLFYEYVRSRLYAETGRAAAFDPLAQQFQDMWKRVLGRPTHSSPNRVVFSVEEACARAAVIFPPRDAGFSMGRYLSPDLMIAASSVDAIDRGEYFGVLGEIHCDNTLVASCLVTQHPDPRVLLQAASTDTLNEFVISVQRPDSLWLARANDAFIRPHHWRYLYSGDPPHYPLGRPLPAGMLRIIDTGPTLMVRAIDGSIQFDALELFGGPAQEEGSRLMNEFVPLLPHAPRISLGKLVIAREQWNVVPGDLQFLRQKDPVQQFLDIRAWGKANNMPRRVFVKSPAERKPWFLDFDSPILTGTFASLMKKLSPNASVKLTEMLPDLDNLWLVDRDGQRFTGELRLLARAVPESAAPAC